MLASLIGIYFMHLLHSLILALPSELLIIKIETEARLPPLSLQLFRPGYRRPEL